MPISIVGCECDVLLVPQGIHSCGVIHTVLHVASHSPRGSREAHTRNASALFYILEYVHDILHAAAAAS